MRHQVDGGAADVGARQPVPAAKPDAAPQGRLEIAARRLRRRLLERYRLVVDQPRHPGRRPWRLQRLHRHPARREVVAPDRHALPLGVGRLVEIVGGAVLGDGVQGAVDAVLLEEEPGDARAARRRHEAAQARMVRRDQHLHGAVDQDAAHQAVDG